MYHLYHTEGFVLRGSEKGEANKSFLLLTRELGLISATAQSVREERSKLRYGLSDFSLAELSLVRGKDSWRITGATLVEDVYGALRASPHAAALFARIFRLLRRLVAGEEKNEQLFCAVKEAFLFLHSSSVPPFLKEVPVRAEDLKIPRLADEPLPLGKGELRSAEVEVVLVLRILYLLGYLAPRGEFQAVLSDVFHWSDALLSEAKHFRTLALQDINHSLRESQL